MGSAGKKLRTRMDIGKDIQNCLDDLNNMTHAKLAELLNLSEKCRFVKHMLHPDQ